MKIALVSVGVLAVAVAIVLGLVIGGVIHISSGSASAQNRSPFEYVYLDPARVTAYLGQLDEGDINQETRTNTLKDSAGAKVQVSSLGELNGSISGERVASAVVAFSEADNFFKLEKELKKEHALEPIQLTPARIAIARLGEQEESTERKLERLPIGKIVKMEGAFLHVPPYLAAYPSLRYAPLRFHSKNKVLGTARLSTLGETEVTAPVPVRRERERFIRRAGRNPRVPFSTKLHHLTIVVPARADFITGDPSLLGTHLTVVGKVVYVGRSFGDAASEATYLPALLRAPSWFLEDVGFQHPFLANYVGKEKRRALREHLFQALQRSLTFTGAVIEIVPIAIYS